jgi:hypothetical protein
LAMRRLTHTHRLSRYPPRRFIFSNGVGVKVSG